MRHRIHLLLALLIGALNVGGACDAFTVIHGTVVQCGTHRPIEGATVQLRDRQSPAKHLVSDTDASGTFQVAQPGNLPPDIFVAAPGYEPKLEHVVDENKATEICLLPKGP